MKSRKAEKSGICAVYSSSVSVTNITHYGATLPLFLKESLCICLETHSHCYTPGWNGGQIFWCTSSEGTLKFPYIGLFRMFHCFNISCKKNCLPWIFFNWLPKDSLGLKASLIQLSRRLSSEGNLISPRGGTSCHFTHLCVSECLPHRAGRCIEVTSERLFQAAAGG